ncbi:MAG: hypothetical protein KJO66_08820 [Gammaproteobacteria bacterium]|nr:hypothetical protein [Gammaproteobacteria bacterium]NNJ94454.1 hypothetical protein [Halobacteria archaeon]
MRRYCLSGLLLIPVQFVCAGEADVLAAKVHCDDESICRFSVTVRHADSGWEHYANRWEILDTSGNVIGVRELAHPHEHEQPFTRSLGNVAVPADISEVVIRARDSVHQYGGRELVVKVRE